MYLEHVTEHVHTLEYGEPELRDAFRIFLWRGFLFLCILNSSLFLYLLLQEVGGALVKIQFTKI